MIKRFIFFFLKNIPFSYIENFYLKQLEIKAEKEWEEELLIKKRAKEELDAFIISKGPDFQDELQYSTITPMVPLGNSAINYPGYTWRQLRNSFKRVPDATPGRIHFGHDQMLIRLKNDS